MKRYGLTLIGAGAISLFLLKDATFFIFSIIFGGIAIGSKEFEV